MEIIYCNCFSEKWNGICLLFGKKFLEAVLDFNESAVNSFKKICREYITNTKVTVVWDVKQFYSVCFSCLNEKLLVKRLDNNTQQNSCIQRYYLQNISLNTCCRNCLNNILIETESDFNKLHL